MVLLYKERFNTVEINNAFYHLPAQKTFRNWRKQGPEGFIYAVKAGRYITHMERLRDPQLALEKCISRVRLLGETLGPILYQLPPRWRPDLDRLKGFIEAPPGDLVHIFEFRDPPWLCQPVYIRLDGCRSLYASRYTQRELEEWARYVVPLLSEGHDVYVYFNNDAFAHAVENARELRHLIEEMVPLEEKV